MSKSDNLEKYGIELEKTGDSAKSFAKFILEEYKLAVYIALVAIVAIAITTIGNITIPSVVSLALKAVAIGIIPATLAGKLLIVDKFMSTRMKRVLALNPKEGYSPDIYFVPPPIWEDKMKNDLPIKSTDDSFIDFIVEFLDYEENENQLYVGGINPEIADPVDIALRDGKLEKIYDELLYASMKLTKLEGTLKTKHLDIQKENINSLISAIEKGTTMDMDKSMSFELDDDLEQFKSMDKSDSQVSDNSENEKEDNENNSSDRMTLNEIEELANRSDNNE